MIVIHDAALTMNQEYHNNPSSIGGRAYTPFARWKFREFNELPHLFTRRLDESYPIANMYIGQYPNEKVAIVMRSVLVALQMNGHQPCIQICGIHRRLVCRGALAGFRPGLGSGTPL